MTNTRVICPELKPILEKLQSEGIKVYSYTCHSNANDEITSLYWYDENRGRVLNIQPSSWYSPRNNRDCFHIGVSYIPGYTNGSGCGLDDGEGWGISSSRLLDFRNRPTWVSEVKHYKSMNDFLKRETVLEFFEIGAE